MPEFAKESALPFEAAEAYQWHARPGALERLTPPWEDVRVVRAQAGLEAGKEVELSVGGPFGRQTWLARHAECEPGRRFVDEQVRGPFRRWVHRHEFEDRPGGGCVMRDVVEYELPMGGAGEALAGTCVARRIERAFAYRHAILAADLDFRERCRKRGVAAKRVLVSGATGFLGNALRAFLAAQGHEVSALTRSPRSERDVAWDPEKGSIDASRLDGFDAVLHLAGESLVGGRWTAERKRRLWDSRVEGTRLLVEALGKVSAPPSAFVCASGVGYYGDAGDRVVDEAAAKGEGFLADLCGAWEREARAGEGWGARVAALRTGVVLDPRGGALKQMLPPFRCGLGGPLGRGRQWMPWIALEDWIHAAAFVALLADEGGPCNLVSPEPVRNAAFARALGGALRRPALLPVPRLALEALFGQMAEEALLASCRAVPARLQGAGCRFRMPRLAEALKAML